MAASALIGASAQVGFEFVLKKIEALVCNELIRSWGLAEDLKKLEKSFLMHKEFLALAESAPSCDRATAAWMEDLEDAVTKADNVLERIRYESVRHKTERPDLRGFFSKVNPKNFPSRVACKVKKINANLANIYEQGTRINFKGGAGNLAPNGNEIAENCETDSVSYDEDEVIGREVEAEALVRKLCNTGDKKLSVFPIVGMGGIGKTTLALSVYSHQKIKERFTNKSCWVSLSEKLEAKRILERMLESLTRTNHELHTRDAIVKKLQEEIGNVSFFLVLDNMWDWEEFSLTWEDLEKSLKGIGGARGNCVLVTTRDSGVAATVAPPSHICNLDKLRDDHCWTILKKRAWPGEATEEIEAIGKKIAEKCLGIPLAANVVGRMLWKKEAEEWESILDEELKELSGDPENRLMQILRLSFDRLPSVWLRKCFAYCSVFGKDFRIEREQLIQLWMAEGLLQGNPQSKKTKEDTGNYFFHQLLQRGLFQDAQKDEYQKVMHCKMHDFVHDLALLVAGPKTASLQFTSKNEISEKVRYLVLGRAHLKVLSSSKEMVKNTRTLFCQGSLSGKTLDYFPFLRVLNICSLDVKQLPDKIGKVFNLRYLDISGTEIVQLPESICKLYFLETLIAKKPASALQFPDKFKNLQSFRFLDYYTKDDSAKMPLEMGQLTCLQKLPFFNVGKEKGRGVQELGPLKELNGSLEIRNLELINGKEEASSAELVQKSKLVNLELEWSSSHTTDHMHHGVLEGLQPNTNLKGLKIQNFLGDQLPAWMARLKLEKLEITGSRRIQQISLGQMPRLRHLRLSKMDELKEWVEDAAGMSRRPFPKLEELTVRDCRQLSTAPSNFPSLKKLEVQSVRHEVVTTICGGVNTLTSLSIVGVEQLTCLPPSLASNNRSLLSITLDNCRHLTQIVPEISGLSTCLQKLQVQDCCELTQLPIDLYTLEALQELQIIGCSKLRTFPCPQENQCLNSLRFLTVCDCEGLTCLPKQIIESCASLKKLWISNCKELTTFEVDFSRTPSLTWLALSECENLRSIPRGLECLRCLKSLWIGPFSAAVEVDSLDPIFNAIQQLSTTLHDLELFARPHWDSLPCQLRHLHKLIKLCLHNFGIEELPDWFESFSLLQKLRLFRCARLHQLASGEAMSRLTKLREIFIHHCPLLESNIQFEKSKIPQAEVKFWS